MIKLTRILDSAGETTDNIWIRKDTIILLEARTVYQDETGEYIAATGTRIHTEFGASIDVAESIDTVSRMIQE